MKNVLDFIPLGRNHAISMNELAMRMGVSQRTARKLVFEARNNGAVICSTCSGDKSAGYYRPISVDEARPYIAMQNHRIISATAAKKSAEKFITEKGACDDNG